MICKCAEADSLRSSFPTMVGGLYLREEMDFSPDIPAIKKPLFEASPSKVVTMPTAAVAPAPEPAAPEPEPQPEAPAPEPNPDDGDLGPQGEPEPEQAAPAPIKNNILKAVRGLCGMAKVKEGEILSYLASSEVGATDGSVTSLEELAMSYGPILQLVHDQWSRISGEIVAARKGGKK
jgi:hypothetical protein